MKGKRAHPYDHSRAHQKPSKGSGKASNRYPKPALSIGYKKGGAAVARHGDSVEGSSRDGIAQRGQNGRHPANNAKNASLHPSKTIPKKARSKKFAGGFQHSAEQESIIVQNVKMLATNAKKYDPVFNPKAWDDAMKQSTPGIAAALAVKSIGVSHDSVGGCFQNGKHAGVSLQKTLEKLKNGTTDTLSFTPIVVMNDRGKRWVIFGNRRLTIAKKYQEWLLREGKDDARIRSENGLGDVRIRAVEYFIKDNPPSEILSKYVLAKTTTGFGDHAAPTRRCREPTSKNSKRLRRNDN
eukprot:GEMP01038130.1.p2 GENE.GEMP01038130.1~~GEMP01038130.1.p2  ORF type:complete len:296 (+),score=63.20 GEMP01038130.1:589-1476(+)